MFSISSSRSVFIRAKVALSFNVWRGSRESKQATITECSHVLPGSETVPFPL